MKKSLLKRRSNVINYIYKFELINASVSAIDAFESGEYPDVEIKIIEAIAKHYVTLKKIASKYLQDDWRWERVSPLERAILIYGAYELSKHDKGLVINELVIIAQGYIPGESYKFINKVLDRIGDYYKKRKQE